MATEIIDAKFTYNPYAWQKEFHIGCKNKRHAVALIPRQHGKTEVAIYELVTRALAGQKGANYAYLSPTLNNGKRVFWDRLKAFLSPLNSQLKIRESELTIELIGHFKIFLLGAKNCVGSSWVEKERGSPGRLVGWVTRSWLVPGARAWLLAT